MISTNNIPQEFICPITLNIMNDPVICEDGYTYERESIMSLPNSLSPMTRNPINKYNLIPNRALKDSIERFKSSNNVCSFTNITTSALTNTNPQMVYPEINLSTHLIRSPWDDKVYKITRNKRTNKWVQKRYATTLIAVLDTSGSMGESCSIGNGAEQDGFSRLNLLQHSMNTAIEMLNSGDELVLIKFNSSSEYIFNEKITQNNKPMAKSVIDSLIPQGGTYIWNGLRQAYESALNASNNNVHIMLLTDGQASDTPYEELKRYISTFSSRPNELEKLKKIKLTTFGFSYDINSKVLFDIAEYTNSCFNFIPDATMVGTVFCNYLANILSPDLFVSQIEQVNLNLMSNQNTTIISNQDFIIPFNSLQLHYSFKYDLIRYHCYQILKDMCMKGGTRRIINSESSTHVKLFGTLIKTLIDSYNDLINSCINSIDSEVMQEYEIDMSYLNLLNNLLKDFVSDDETHEQITKAISRPEWFNKWGYHYLLSLSLAHLTRQCHNFKDQGVQLYGSDLFQQLQNEAQQIFSTIPPPRPSLRTQVVRTSMSAYVDRSGGCFSPKCKIRLSDNTLKAIDKLNGSELIWQGDKVEGVKIKYIIKTEIPSGIKSMCKINKLIISDYHPIFDFNSKGWVFPNQLVEPKEFPMNLMYNIVLESGHWVEIEGFKCVSLGHQLKQFDTSNQILSHDYFGTAKVIKDLEDFSRATCLMSSIPKIIHIYDYEILRDPSTNLVCGIIPKKYH